MELLSYVVKLALTGGPSRKILHFLKSSNVFLCSTGPNWKTVKHFHENQKICGGY